MALDLGKNDAPNATPEKPEKVRDVHYQLNALDGALAVLDKVLGELFDRLMVVAVKEDEPDTCKGLVVSAPRISPVGCRIKGCRETLERMVCDIKRITEDLQI